MEFGRQDVDLAGELGVGFQLGLLLDEVMVGFGLLEDRSTVLADHDEGREKDRLQGDDEGQRGPWAGFEEPTPASMGPLPADKATALDAAAASAFKNAASPGAVVAVRGPQGTWTKAYGVADKTTNTPMSNDGHQRIGSVTKTFIGTVLLQLAEEGKLSLDDPIDKYVPGVPNGATVTLRQLASMTSGVASYTLDKAWQKTYFSQPYKVWTPDELLKIGLALPARFPPGTTFDYSNTNTILLGKVIEKQAGQDIATVLQTRIFDPLKLTATSFPGTSPVLPDPHPRGYTLQGNVATPDKPVDATDWNPSWGWAAGEMISRIDDLLVYGRALGTGQGLLTAATQVQRLNSLPEPAGYGIAVGCVDGWVGHTGELPGFNTSVFYDTRSDTTVVVETNSDIASGDCTLSPTLADNPIGIACADPATQIFVGVSQALGHQFTPNPKK